MRRRDYVVIYPAYLDLRKSRAEGRRVPKRYAVKAPTLQELVKALDLMGLRYEVEPGKAYPKEWWVKGRILVSSRDLKARGLSKQRLLRELGEQILSMRKGLR